ncbi:MAG: hypothetical protein HYY18_20095 [Planctomycetes bacterium]|nr:hypothetical protein [Planctomycetota bacterium]
MELHQLEAFALARDRAKALEQLIPGTDEFYFHQCLVHEQKGDLKAVADVMKTWNDRCGETALFQEIRNRLNLLRYEEAPAETLEYLRYHLGLEFNHERAVEGRRTKLPSKLDPRAVSRDAVRQLGLAHSNGSDLAGFTDAALEWLADESHDGHRLRSLLGRLRRPDVAKLPEMVAAELKDRHTSGFGAIPIHNLMLQEQLEKLRKLVPDLIQNEAFVYACLLKLRPGPDVDLQNDPAEREKYLAALWDFVKGLAPKFNPLKAHVLYHRLDHDRRAGAMDRVRFTEYLKLPRQVGYANAEYLKQFRRDDSPFGLGQDYRHVTLQAAVNDDEELVRHYLGTFFAGAKDFKPFDTWIDAAFLREVFASTKLLQGTGDPGAWTAMINDPAACQALKERVEIGFALTNRTWFAAGDPVTLDVDVKNVPTLVVKVFEINALNYFLANGRDVDTSIDLDGLVASEEQTHRYAEAPIRRVRRTFPFPALAAPGAYIVEFIGGGISSRALVRKGRLRFLERAGSAGHVFTVLDENREVLRDASVWLGGREYRAEADGSIAVPFSTHPGRQTVLLRHGNLTTLEAFDHQAETYALTAGLYVDRESLIRKREAQVVLRPTLQVNGAPASLSLLEEPALVIQSTDRDGVSSSLEVRDFKVQEDAESVHAFQVPENLASISFSFRARVQSLSQSRKVDLSDGSGFQLNGIDAEATIEDLHLARTAAGYVVTHCGKSGEPKAGTALAFSFRHRDITPAIDVTLQTDAEGRVELGHLRDILEITASTPAGVTETWTPPRDRFRAEPAVHVRAGEAFRVPFMEEAPLGGAGYPDAHGREAAPGAGVEHRDVSLFDRVGDTFVRDHFKALARKDGYLEVAGLPAGDYDLLLKRDGVAVTVRVAPGADRDGWVAGEKRHLERHNARPLQIGDVTARKSDVRISVGNAHGRARVHVFGTRFVPAYSCFDELGRAPGSGARAVEVWKAASHYVSGRDIGDEYRYILERKQSEKFAGNTLARPGLLLNPWAIRSTETATQEAQAGGAYGASAQPVMSAAACAPPEPGMREGAAGAFANLDFLANPAAVLLNLRPDDKGVVTVPREAFAHANSLRIVAIDALNTVCRDVLLPEVRTPHEDLRLRLALDADRHFSEKKQVSVLAPAQPLEIADITTSKTEVYDTLARVYRLYATLSNNPELTQFGFVLRWPGMTEEEKRAKYSEFACHELSFFLSRKDPEFFRRVVQPYLRNKMHKTFMDRYLLEGDLSEDRRPWAFGRLNIVERILLARRIDDEGDPVARHGRDLNDLLPRDLERAEHLFGSAILGSALETGDKLGIAGQAASVEKSALARLDESLQMPMGAAMAAPASMAPKGGRRSPAKESRSKKMKSESPRDEEADSCVSEDMAEMRGAGMDDFDRGEKDARSRGKMRAFYQKLDKTQEWAENNYWHLPIEQQGPELVTINPFWRDFAAHRGGEPFLSPNLAHASRSFAEMMLALAVLDLPFEAEKPAVMFEGARMKLACAARAVAFHKEIKPVEPAAERVPILVSQNYFRDDDRTRYENDEEVDKYVTGEFLVNVVYTCQVVLTNPTSTNQKLDLLLQIPTGSIPVRCGFVTRGRHVELSSYATESIEYAFYFPAPGTFAHFPVHVAKNEQLIASAEPARLKVVRELSAVDKTSWAWLSQNGDEKDVLAWMEKNNVDRLAAPDGDGEVGLELIAWRVRDRGFYGKCLALLARRHIYNNTLWAYSVHHKDVANIREFLLHQGSFLDRCGLWLKSPLVTIDPVARRRYQHLEYAPLVNARTHKLGARRKILNDRFGLRYAQFMGALRYRARLSDADLLAVTYDLFLQDRVAEALESFDRIDARNLETWLQYDYLKVYAEFFRENAAGAREIAERHKDEPVDRWRHHFRNALAQIDEIAGAAAQVVDDKDRDQRQAKLAATEPDFDFTVEKKTVTLNVQNLAAVRVNYYRMDIELLFSRQPFVQQQSDQFSYIRPNRSEEVRVPAGRNQFAFDLPAEFHGANVIVELVAEGRRKSQAYYAHELLVQVVESFGQVRVALQGTNRPLPKTYVKVYSRMKGGEVKFYKDGYTDLRGVFDFTSLNTNELDYVDRFSILVLHEKHGAVIREAGVPKR